jgi:hypothetical protein
MVQVKRSVNPFCRRLGRPQSQYGCCGVTENFLALLGIEPEPSIPQAEAILTELSLV